MSDGSTVEERIRALEDAEQIRNLKATYATYCDDNYNADKIAELFTEDAVWVSKGLGKTIEGREAIRQFFREVSDLFLFSVHFNLNPHIVVDGDRAWGRWLTFNPCIVRGDIAMWRAGIDEEEYARVDGAWMFKSKTASVTFSSTFEEGWAKDRFVPVAR